jgi:hypothetical protein
MGSIHEKSSVRPRDQVFELLVECRFLTCTKEDCPIWKQRKSLSIEKKHEFVMRLNAEEIKNILAHYDCCYEKRLSDLNHW